MSARGEEIAMDEFATTIAQWRRDGARMALATVINVEGSAPRDEGAKMLIAHDGRIAGSVSGGCVESAVAQAAMDVIETGKPAIARFGIDKAMIWDVGLSCGGEIDVFIEPLPARLGQPSPTQAFAICTVVRGPARVGAKLFVDEDGKTEGTLGGDRLDAQAKTEALRLLEAGQSRMLTIDDHDVFVDAALPKARLLIVGAVHIAEALCKIAALAGFSVTVIDPRPLLCNRERFPDAAALVVDWPEDALAKLSFDDRTYVAVLAHDAKFDDPTLLRVLPTRARYVGAIGSKKTQAARRERLAAAGIAREDIERLHGPIGLDIGAQSPEEIAVAILAEMLAAKHHRSGSPLRVRIEQHIHA
ncbi:MAG TPA: XdhC/CoxI family protein [Candidatus Acidoferrales bacterium]|nr:XdhC/CoxI family protein [Candidatus Acidoferrales bacterium]